MIWVKAFVFVEAINHPETCVNDYLDSAGCLLNIGRQVDGLVQTDNRCVYVLWTDAFDTFLESLVHTRSKSYDTRHDSNYSHKSTLEHQ